MRTIALVCQKGGAGKTTMAVHLAVEGQRRGYKTLLIDIDPQASAAKIIDRRGNEPPDVATEAAGRLDRALKVADSQGYALVIVDTAPQADQAAAQAARIADLVVTPLQPSIVDLDAVDSTIDVCKLGGAPILFVLNRVPTRGREIEGTGAAIRKRGMKVAVTRWGERKAFKYPLMRGLVAQEVEPDSLAASEVAALFDELGMTEGTHVHRNTGVPSQRSTGTPSAMRAGAKA